MWGEKPWSHPTDQWILSSSAWQVFFAPHWKGSSPRELCLSGMKFKASPATQHNRWWWVMQNRVSAYGHKVNNISKAFPLMTVVVILLPSSALLFPIALSAVLDALRTHVTWRRNLHVTALCTLRGKSTILPGSSQVYREETAEGHFHTKSICFCLMLGCFWSTCRSVTPLLGWCFPYWDVTVVATFEPS